MIVFQPSTHYDPMIIINKKINLYLSNKGCLLQEKEEARGISFEITSPHQ